MGASQHHTAVQQHSGPLPVQSDFTKHSMQVTACSRWVQAALQNHQHSTESLKHRESGSSQHHTAVQQSQSDFTKHSMQVTACSRWTQAVLQHHQQATTLTQHLAHSDKFGMLSVYRISHQGLCVCALGCPSACWQAVATQSASTQTLSCRLRPVRPTETVPASSESG